jgi:connector enhancer of kinase suppressor of Ras 2
MAYVNVRDWSVDQVTDWLKGLDSIILQYTTSFLNNGVTGHQLLSLRAEDLYNLGVKSLGHQEVILESVEHLRHFVIFLIIV